MRVAALLALTILSTASGCAAYAPKSAVESVRGPFLMEDGRWGAVVNETRLCTWIRIPNGMQDVRCEPYVKQLERSNKERVGGVSMLQRMATKNPAMAG